MNRKQFIVLGMVAVVAAGWTILTGCEDTPTREEYDVKVLKMRRDKLEQLDQADAGASIADAPAGTYFFIPPDKLVCEPGGAYQILTRRGISPKRENSDYFEIHKQPEEYRSTIDLIGFQPPREGPVGSEDANKTTIYPYSCEEANDLLVIMLPENLGQAKARKVTLSDGNEVTVLDIVLREEG